MKKLLYLKIISIIHHTYLVWVSIITPDTLKKLAKVQFIRIKVIIDLFSIVSIFITKLKMLLLITQARFH